MWKIIGAAALALVVLSSAWAQGTPPNPKAGITRNAIAKQSSQPLTPGYRACSFCYTCGGPWPYLAGTFYTPAPAYTVERGAYCSGPLAYRNDYTPYLCCGLDQ